jgi:hypothetical protein
MPAPRSATYVAGPNSPFPGRVFTGTPGTSQAYNQYQRARSQALGFSTYREQRTFQQTSAWKGLVTAETKRGKFGAVGKLGNAARSQLLNIAAKYRGQNLKDRSYGGVLDQYLRELGRRNGTETWRPGETPRMVRGAVA